MRPTRLIACPTCGQHRAPSDAACFACSAASPRPARSRGGLLAASLLGLGLSLAVPACSGAPERDIVQEQPYGVPPDRMQEPERIDAEPDGDVKPGEIERPGGETHPDLSEDTSDPQMVAAYGIAPMAYREVVATVVEVVVEDDVARLTLEGITAMNGGGPGLIGTTETGVSLRIATCTETGCVATIVGEAEVPEGAQVTFGIEGP